MAGPTASTTPETSWPGTIGWRSRRAVVAEPDAGPVELARADATGMDPDEDIAGSQRREPAHPRDQSGRVALRVGVQGAHGSHLLLASGSLAASDGPDEAGIHASGPSLSQSLAQ